MIKHPSKTQTVTTVIVLVVAGLVGYSVYLYQSQPNRHPAPTESVSQLKQQRDDAVKAVRVHDAVNKQNEDELKNSVFNLSAQKTTLCTQLKAARMVNAICN
jgi:hypothetical protein